mmetsp:Transcript_12516/g.38700  ORF Transcript_12516/g.38700 Transcript_12516/m.38700 type:complete len:229 (+) Transcript_12516:623-1309(+)
MMVHTPSSSDISVTPASAMILWMVSPPLPMILARSSCGYGTFTMRGADSASSPRGGGLHLAISPRMCVRPCLAFSSARRMMPMVMPSTLMSIWKAVTPSSLPAILKSISPSASSDPRMSVRMMASSSAPPSSGRTNPMATPATRARSGTPASSIARQPPHTLAMLLDPLLSVMLLSTRVTYPQSPDSKVGSAGRSAFSASAPWPISRRPGAPVRPTSPTELGGKEYCK